jgi:phenylpropionate dioxygenase-like ring-hydroxylating dioxygenase large terminal subunit
MSIDLKKEREKIVSGSANVFYDEEVKITGERYTSHSFMEKEMDKVWAKVWNIGGWSNEIPESGDYITHEIGRESILMVRQEDHSIKAFHNVCPHRGNRLVHDDNGSSPSFTCTYHGWKFNNEGILIYAQDEDDFPQGNPCGKINLTEIPCEIYGGFIWYNMNENCSSLFDFLGEVKKYFDMHDLNGMKRVYYKVSEVPFNWKALRDNFNESYHLPMTHPQIIDYFDDDYKNTDFELFETGHNLMKMKGCLPSLRDKGTFEMNEKLEGDLLNWNLNPKDFDGKAHLVREALQKQKRKLGSKRGFDHFERMPDAWLTDAFHFNIFPGTSITFTAEVCTLQRTEPHPTDPNKSIYDHWQMALRATDSENPETNPTMLVASPEDMVEWKEVDKHVVIFGEETLSDVADQDLDRSSAQQLGFHSRGFKGAYLSGQENRVQQFHNFIDRYIYDKL